MKQLMILALGAVAISAVSGCGGDSDSKPATKTVVESKAKSVNEEFDNKYLSEVRTLTKVPDLEMEVYRKAARKTLEQFQGESAEKAAKARGIELEDLQKMMVEGLIKEVQRKLRSARRDASTPTQQKVLLQGILNSL